MQSTRSKESECSCSYCGRLFMATPSSLEENPFCAGCLSERIAVREAQIGPVSIVEDGDYLIVRSRPLGTRGSMPS